MRSKPMKRVGAVLSLLLLLPGCASVLRATRDDDRGTLARLLRSGASPDEASDDGTTPLFEAIEANNFAVARMLVDAGADVNKESRCRGRSVTPLHKAVIHGNLAFVRYLLDKGADATAIASGKNVFVLMAGSDDATQGSARMTRMILQNIEAKHGREAARAFLDKQTPSGWTALAAAAYFGDEDLVDALVAGGAAVTALAKASNADSSSSDEWPPLHFAAVAGHDDVAARLVRAGADPKQKSRDGHTSSEVIAELRQRRAEEEARRREEQREEAERSRAQFQAFQAGLQGLQKPNPSNPVEDDSFQRKMQAIHEQSKKQGSAPQERSSAAESAPSTSNGARSSSSGTIVLSGGDEAATPRSPSAPPDAKAPSPAAPGPTYTPPADRPRDCREVPNEGPVGVRTGMYSSPEIAEDRLQDDARRKCAGPDYSLRDKKCVDHKLPILEPQRDGTIKRTGVKVTYGCSAYVVCAKPKQECTTRPGGGAATKQ